MSYARYLVVLRRYAWIIVLLTALGAASSFYFANRQPKVYQATATLLINPAAPNQAIQFIQQALGAGSNGQTNIQQLAATYDVYLTSDAFAQVVQRELGITFSPSQLSSSLVGNTPYWRISATANDPQTASRIA